MIKNIYNKVSALFISIFMILSIAGCQNSEIDSLDGKGALVLSITRAQSTGSALPENTTLRIFNTSDRLIARYTDSEIPSAIYLAAGDYKATVEIGEVVEISDTKEVISYAGATDFTIEGGKVNDLNIKCTVRNTVVEVVFDPTVTERFEKEAVSYLSLSNSFSFDDAESGAVPTLTFRDSGTGYFILPEGVDNIAWGFYGESENIDPTTPVASKTARFTGAIENAKAATKYTLKFAYSATPDGYLDLTVTVDESVDEFNDIFSFSPQPRFVGQGFDIYADGLAFSGEDMVVDVKSVNELSTLKITSEEFTSGDISIMEGGVINAIDGIDLVMSDTKNGVLTLSKNFFANFGGYGNHTMRFAALDVMDSEGHEDMTILTGGVNGGSYDLWVGSGDVTAKLLYDDVSSVKFAIKTSESAPWREVDAVKGDDNTYTAHLEPTWRSATNSADLTTYTLESGFRAESNYQCKLIIDGKEFAPATLATPAGQSVPNGDLSNSNIAAYTTSSSDSKDWTSGNNTFAKDLCKHAIKNDRGCALLASRTAAGVFAAGNLAYGCFAMSGMSGTVNFGQSFTWTARPTSLRFSYAATIGDETHDKGNRLDGKDVARVYFAIVDWSARHGVTAGTSGTPSGTWDPATQLSTDEGKIIGYASVMITESSADFIDIEIPVQYYDYSIKPSGKYTLVISCAASAYGDYMTGSTGSRLWVDDFKFGY